MIPSTQLKREAKRRYNSSIWVISCALPNSREWKNSPWTFFDGVKSFLISFRVSVHPNLPAFSLVEPSSRNLFCWCLWIHNVHHNNFKLCNSNLEGSICHSCCHSSVQRRSTKISPSIFLRSQVLVKSFSTSADASRKAIFSWILKSRKWFLMVLGAQRSLNVW